jgi:processive 1,2-diacylglycerol beta-glucosyltransferase
MTTIRRTPELWEALYDNFWFDWLTRWIRPLVQRGNSLKLRILMDAFQPDAIVCTQAHPFSVLSAYARRQGKPIPLWGVITDFLPHRFWHVPPDEHIRYVVPAETAMQRLMILGTPAERIHVFGIPIQADVLARASAPSRAKTAGASSSWAARAAWARATPRSGSSTGPPPTSPSTSSPAPTAAAQAAAGPRATSSGTPSASAATSRTRWPSCAAPACSSASPAAWTSAEAMASGTPMLIIRPMPGQERGNTETLVRHGAAIHLDRDRDLPAVVASLLSNERLLDMVAARAPRVGKPDAAREIPKPCSPTMPPEEAPAE